MTTSNPSRPDAENARRRAFLRQGGLYLVALSGTAVLASLQARADSDMLSQAAVHYQKIPHDGQKCSDCAYFIPGSSSIATSSCRLVEGTIYPNGWCIHFSS